MITHLGGHTSSAVSAPSSQEMAKGTDGRRAITVPVAPVGEAFVTGSRHAAARCGRLAGALTASDRGRGSSCRLTLHADVWDGANR